MCRLDGPNQQFDDRQFQQGVQADLDMLVPEQMYATRGVGERPEPEIEAMQPRAGRIVESCSGWS